MSNESGKKQRLLIVDDSRVIRVTARKILQDHFETVEAVDGENAWDLLKNSEPFSLVVSDLTMPNLDGFGLLKLVRNSPIPHVKAVPVIIITGANDSEATKQRATEAGATDFIGKPFDSVHLLARTQAHANAHTNTQTLTGENLGLEAQALTDPLTGLSNEAAFMDHSYQQLSYAVRHKTSLAVFRIDIDKFGALFKQHGKDISDAVIKSVATVLQSAIRHEDIAARVGTARFSLLLPSMGKTGIRNLAERINSDISARILKSGHNRIHYTVSIGVAAPEIRRDTRFDELLSTADSRLHYASSRGGNQVVFEDPAPEVPAHGSRSPLQVTVPVLLEDDIAAMINQPVESEIEYEDIVIDNSDLDELAAVESRATRESDGLPGQFAGPVPELSLTTATRTIQEGMSSTAAQGQNPFMFDHNAEDDETIIITAPYDSSDPFEEIREETPTTAETPATDIPPYHEADAKDRPTVSTGSDVDVIPADTNTIQPEAAPETVIMARPGIFRRMFSGLAFLFRRSRQPG